MKRRGSGKEEAADDRVMVAAPRRTRWRLRRNPLAASRSNGVGDGGNTRRQDRRHRNGKSATGTARYEP